MRGSHTILDETQSPRAELKLPGNLSTSNQTEIERQRKVHVDLPILEDGKLLALGLLRKKCHDGMIFSQLLIPIHDNILAPPATTVRQHPSQPGTRVPPKH
jgi:hypothetical protein